MCAALQARWVGAMGGGPPPPPPPCTLNCGSHGSRSSAYDDCHCKCESGYKGATCSAGTGCDSSPNCGHGSCVANGGSHTCSCQAGWSGPTCSHPTGCDGNKDDCLNGATCVPDGGSRSCSCTSCYRGGTCGTPIGCSGKPNVAHVQSCGQGDCATKNSCTAQCMTGYNPSGDTKYSCTDSNSGNWEGGSLTCTAKKCNGNPSQGSQQPM
jgi:hypothetical protein